MKIPCEVVVWDLLPTLRKGVAKELVTVHGFTQSRVAKVFGVTDAAVSQYLRNKRGEYDVVVNNPGFSSVQEEISAVAARIANTGSDFAEEVCNVCMVAKSCGILANIYQVEFGTPYPDCDCESQSIMKPA